MAKDIEIIYEISSLTCCVCYEKISETKTLLCSHSICSEPCLRHCLDETEPRCPMCQELIRLPPSGRVSDLPSNHGLGSVLRSYRHSVKSTPSSLGDYLTPNNLDLPINHTPDSGHETQDTKTDIAQNATEEEVCGHHRKSLRFFCNSCSDNVCFTCIRTMHREHEFFVRDTADDDGVCMIDTVVKELRQKKRHKNISLKLLLSRENYTEASRSTREEIKETAKRVHELIDKEEDILLKELEALTVSRAEYFTNLYMALESVMVKGNKLSSMIKDLGNIMEDRTTFIGLKDLENLDSVLTDVDKKTQTLEKLCDYKHPNLQFIRQNIYGKLLGNLQKVRHVEEGQDVNEESLRTFALTKMKEIDTGRYCVSIVWLDGDRCIAVNDKRSVNGVVELRIVAFGVDVQYKSEELKRTGHETIHVCSSKSSHDECTVLLAHGRDVIRVTFDKGNLSSPKYKQTRLTFKVEAVCWGQSAGEYFVLSSHPWQVIRVNATGSTHSISPLESMCYGPLIATVSSSFVVADISENAFIVKDTMKVFPDRLVEAPGNLQKAWPSGITFNHDTNIWFLLWKSISSQTEDDIDWMLTRHTASFEFRGIVLSGSMANRDPRSMSAYKDKLTILYHGGKVVIYTTHIGNITIHRRSSPSSKNVIPDRTATHL